jgi:hypothetical protein
VEIDGCHLDGVEGMQIEKDIWVDIKVRFQDINGDKLLPFSGSGKLANGGRQESHETLFLLSVILQSLCLALWVVPVDMQWGVFA